jgi:hypothetical protein
MVAVVAVLTLAALGAARTPLATSALARLDAFCERRALAIGVCALLAFVGSAAVSLLVEWPVPVVHDEMSYVLAGETFAAGRLANPTHDHWQHFETFYVFHEPTYASRFPPAQGLALALGQVLASSQVVGLWLSGAFMVAAVCWALFRFVDPRWAFLMGVATACQVGIATYWTQSFWGGAVAAAGGALLLGGVVTLTVAGSARHGAIAAVGLLILANSRPFEGAVISLGPALVLLGALLRGRLAPRALVPGMAVFVAGLVAMGAYNARVTGNVWELPYLHYESMYMERPLLSFQHGFGSHEFRHDEMRRYHQVPEGGADHDAAQAARRWFISPWRLDISREFLLGRVLVVPFLFGLVVCVGDRRLRYPASMLLAAIVATVFMPYYKPHYLAPVTVAVYAVVAIGMQRLSAVRLGGVAWGGAIAAALLASVCVSTVPKAARIPHMQEVRGYAAFARARADVVSELNEQPGKDLVIVRYGADHKLHREWVYNRADIDAADVVWARDMDEARNASLLDYFSDRDAWILAVGFDDGRDGLLSYGDAAAPPRRD